MLRHPLPQDICPKRVGIPWWSGKDCQSSSAHRIKTSLVFEFFCKEKKSTYMEVIMRDLYGVGHVGLFFGLHNAASQGNDTLGTNQSVPTSQQNQV